MSDVEKIEKSDADWKAELTPEQHHVLREKGTERAWTGVYNDFKGDGMFHCAGCHAPLFDAATKFDSGSGWPSFYDRVHPAAVKQIRDVTHGMIRDEVVCAKCDGHLWHVFPDGPHPTGQRYCINSLSIVHEKDKK